MRGRQGAHVTLTKNTKKQLTNIAVLLVLIGITLIILFTSNRELNFGSIWEFLRQSRPLYLVLAFACMLIWIACEGISLRIIARKLGYKCKMVSAMAYSCADIYYSALTPSASGGQPASAYYMIKDGIDGGGTSFILIFNLIAYTFAIFVVAAFGFILRPAMFLGFEFFVKFLIIIGLVIQALLLGFFIACMCWSNGLRKAGNGIISLLSRMKIIKNTEKWRNKLDGAIDTYHAGFVMIRKHKSVFFWALIFNIAQRVVRLLIPAFVCYSVNPDISFWEVIAMEAYVTIGYNSIPIPGGVGAFEYMYMNVYSVGFEASFILASMMVTRTISYYLSMVVSGAYTLTYHGIQMRKKKVEQPQAEGIGESGISPTESVLGEEGAQTRFLPDGERQTELSVKEESTQKQSSIDGEGDSVSQTELSGEAESTQKQNSIDGEEDNNAFTEHSGDEKVGSTDGERRDVGNKL